jgi:DNA polymerase-4
MRMARSETGSGPAGKAGVERFDILGRRGEPATRMPLRCLTIDFNCYFASVEQQERPELRGRPVAVVPLLAETTGCIAVSLEARARGLKRNLRVAEARRLCPGLAVVESRPEVYIAYHRRLVAIVEHCLHVVKTQSIDEVTCALTATYAPPDRAVAVAHAIKDRIRREAGPCLRSSIGIAPNWLLAKVASDLEKPDGLVVLDDADLPDRLAPLAIDDICGIGPNIARRLRAHGIDSVPRLYAATLAELRGLWGGVRGEQMFRLLHGEDLPFFEQAANRTIGHGHVLPPHLRHEEAALAVLHRLVQKAAMRLRHAGHYAGGLHLRLRDRAGAEWSDELRCSETQDTLELTCALNQLWARRPADWRRRPPRQVGIALTHLLGAADHTPDLFEVTREQSRRRLFAAVDTLNQTFGKNSVYFGGAHGATDYAPMRIAFTRIPEPELEEIDAARGRRLRPKPPAPPPSATPEGGD